MKVMLLVVTIDHGIGLQTSAATHPKCRRIVQIPLTLKQQKQRLIISKFCPLSAINFICICFNISLENCF